MERRYAKELRERTAEEAEPDADPDVATDRMVSVDVRAFAAPDAQTEARVHDPARAAEERPEPAPAPARRARPRPGATDAERVRRAQRLQVLARRLAHHRDPLPGLHPRRGRRGGRRPALPLGTRGSGRAAEHVHRASAGPGAAPVRLHHGPSPGRGGGAAPAREPPPQAPAGRGGPRRARRGARSAPPRAGARARGLPAGGRTRRALVEQTDHAEWVDQQRERGRTQGDSWEPVPVPLPTYVTAPVAPRATGGVEVGNPETWSAARSSAAEPTQTGTSHPAAPPVDPAPRQRTNHSRRTRDRGRTPLFDQYEDGDRPRAANE